MREKNLFQDLTLSVACIVALSLTGCWVPEKFAARIVLNEDATYVFAYEGTLVFAMARAAAVRGELSAKDEADLKTAEQELRKDPAMKQAVYLGRGTFQVHYEKRGHVSEPFYFLGRDNRLFSIEPGEDGTVVIAGTAPDEKAVRDLAQIQVTVDGTFEVQTSAVVLRHNAPRTPPIGFPVGRFRWDIKSAESAGPQLQAKIRGLARTAYPTQAATAAPAAGTPSWATQRPAPAPVPAAPTVQQSPGSDSRPPTDSRQAGAPLTQAQLEQLLKIRAPDAAVARQIRERGLAFAPSRDTLAQLRVAGAGEDTLGAVASLLPLLDDAKRQIPVLLNQLFRALDEGNREVLRPFVQPELLNDSTRLDNICKPFQYQAHTVEAIYESQPRVFTVRLHVLTRDLREIVSQLEFVPAGEQFILRDAQTPRDIFQAAQAQQAADVARRLLYAVCANRDDIVGQLTTPGLVGAVQNAGGWNQFFPCQQPSFQVAEMGGYAEQGLKLGVRMRIPSGNLVTTVVDWIENSPRVVKLEVPSRIAAVDPQIGNYTRRRFGLAEVATAPPVSEKPASAPVAPAEFKQQLEIGAASFGRGDYAGAVRALERARQVNPGAAEAGSLLAGSYFGTGNFEQARASALNVIQAGAPAVFHVKHRHVNPLLKPMYPMSVGVLSINSLGIGFSSKQCAHSFETVPFSRFTAIELRNNGLLLHLEFLDEKGSRKFFDFADLGTAYDQNNNIRYQSGRQEAMGILHDVVHVTRSMQPK